MNEEFFDEGRQILMFHFNRKPDGGFLNQLSQRYQEKQAMREQANRQMLDDALDKLEATQTIASYFNQQARMYPGYMMTIREHDGAGSVELASPLQITSQTIQKIQQSEGVFLEGHVRTGNGLIQDVYDSAYPDEVMREHCGRRDIVTSEDLVQIEEENRARRMVEQARKMPKTTVVYKDDIMDIPISNSGNESDMSF